MTVIEKDQSNQVEMYNPVLLADQLAGIVRSPIERHKILRSAVGKRQVVSIKCDSESWMMSHLTQVIGEMRKKLHSEEESRKIAWYGDSDDDKLSPQITAEYTDHSEEVRSSSYIGLAPGVVLEDTREDGFHHLAVLVNDTGTEWPLKKIEDEVQRVSSAIDEENIIKFLIKRNLQPHGQITMFITSVDELDGAESEDENNTPKIKRDILRYALETQANIEGEDNFQSGRFTRSEGSSGPNYFISVAGEGQLQITIENSFFLRKSSEIIADWKDKLSGATENIRSGVVVTTEAKFIEDMRELGISDNFIEEHLASERKKTYEWYGWLTTADEALGGSGVRETREMGKVEEV